MKTRLVRARAVLRDRVLDDASVLVEDGVIASVDGASGNGAVEIDLAGRTLMPGLVDLHCDFLEKVIEPRPGVFFPVDFAVAQADRTQAAAGITTPYYALSFAEGELGVRSIKLVEEVIRALAASRPSALVDTRIHLRYEVTDASAIDALIGLVSGGLADLVSVMDHTPGQGQFPTHEKYLAYLMKTYRKTREEADATIRKKEEARSTVPERTRRLAAEAKRQHVPLASHDDDTPARVAEMAELGVRISEFPMNLETARAARERGIATLLGAPNVVRGGSQSGSMRAVDAFVAGVGDCLCADYVPSTMMAAVYVLAKTPGLDLAAAVRVVSLNPARAAGLEDRGEIAAGQRADLVEVEEGTGEPRISSVWSKGRRVASFGA